jgi:hypothetical protein
LFEENELHPSGLIEGPLSFGDKSVETPILEHYAIEWVQLILYEKYSL